MSRYTSQRLPIKGMKENQVVVRNAHGRKRLFIKHANKLYSTALYSNTKSDRVIKLIRNDLRVTGPLKVGSEGYLSLTDNEIDVSSGNLVLDVAGDISLNADGGEVTIGDAAATVAQFSSASSVSKLSLFSQADSGDLFKVETTTHGATTITTTDDDATAAHLTLDVDGAYYFKKSGSLIGTLLEGVNITQLQLTSIEDGGDYFSVTTTTHGATTISTVDDDGANANLAISPDGNLEFDSNTGLIKMTEDRVEQTLDVDSTANHTTSAYTLDLDVDGIIASGQTGNNIGFNIDLNSDSPTMVGAVNNYGMDIDVVAGTSGTQINYGIDLSVTGADTNTGMRIDTTGTHLMLRYNSDDYASINVADTGDLVVATYGDGTTDSDLTLNIDGDIELNADGGDITFKDASADLAALSSSGLTISNISEVGSDTDKFIMSDSGVLKYVTGANLRSYIGAGTGDGDITGVDLTGGTGIGIASESGTTSGDYSATINCDLEGTELKSTGEGGGSKFLREDGDGTCSWQTVSASGNFLTDNAADTMTVSDFGANAALKIDADQPATAGAEDSIGLHIDYDRAVATSGTAAHNDIGIDLDVNAASLGTSTVKGMDIDVVGATSGTHTATGIDLNVSGADDHIGLAITTPDSASGRKDIRLYSSGNAADYCTISTAGNGATTIETVDGDSNVAHLTITADGEFALNSSSGKFKAQNNGTEFSAADSAYAGMMLGFTTMDYASTSQFYATTTSFAVITKTYDHGDGSEAHYLGVTFVVPPSNKIEIEVFLPYCTTCDGLLNLGLATDTSATTLDARYQNYVWDVDESDAVCITKKWVVDGSDHSWSAGQSKTLYCMAKENSAGGRLYWGDGLANYGDMTMKVTALPATIGDGT